MGRCFVAVIVAICIGACSPNGREQSSTFGAARGASVDDSGTCVDTVLCIRGRHWDSVRCACVVDTELDAGVDACPDARTFIAQPDAATDASDAASDAERDACVQYMMCTTTHHWDKAECRCVPNE